MPTTFFDRGCEALGDRSNEIIGSSEAVLPAPAGMNAVKEDCNAALLL